MGSSTDRPDSASPEFLAVFRAAAGGGGVMTFARFMELALYHPVVGYYQRDRVRIGQGGRTDFFTATTSGPMFGELVSAACTRLLGVRDPRRYTFIEIGAEPGQCVLAEVAHPFGRVETRRLGEPPALAGECVVFSNELFDAQPCIRTVYRKGRWHEIGVALDGDGLVEVELPPGAPGPGREGYRFDQPRAAAKLAGEIAAESWRGLFVAFDYGKTLAELAQNTPAGTVRACHRHVQSHALLARPGEQDLTCHVCWDWLSDALVENGFSQPVLEFQESFFIHHAADCIAAISATEAGLLSRRKLALLQLLHPSHLGQKFQVLHALR